MIRARAARAARVLAGAAALAGACALHAAEADDLKALRAKLEALRSEVAATEDRRAAAADELRAAEQAISDANRALAEVAVEQRAAQAEQARLAAEVRRAQAELDARSGDLGRLLYLRYTAGDASALRVLLSGEDAGRIARQLAYFGYLSRAQLDFVDALRRDVARLADLERRATEKAAEIAVLADSATRERRTLAQQQADRRRTLDRIGADLGRQRAEVSRLQADETRLAKLVEDIARALRSAPPPARREAPRTVRPDASKPTRTEAVPQPGMPDRAFAALKGHLRLPVRGELRGRFGTQRTGQPGGGKGVFIVAREGEEVRAVAAGRVVFADWMRGFGNLLIVDHGDDYLTIYANNEAVLKRLGDAVHGGEAVATVGSSGGAETSGLYFEIRHQGRAFDPLPWVSSK